MAICAVMRISNAQGECSLDIEDNPKKATWIELQSWDWEVEAETSWTKGGGASVGKPNPGKLNWSHYFDRSSCTLLKYICQGAAFDEVELRMFKGTGSDNRLGSKATTFFKMFMKGAFITKVKSSATEEGNIQQEVEMVFKEVTIDYFMQDAKGSSGTAGGLTANSTYYWDIPGGKATG